MIYLIFTSFCNYMVMFNDSWITHTTKCWGLPKSLQEIFFSHIILISRQLFKLLVTGNDVPYLKGLGLPFNSCINRDSRNFPVSS